MYLDLEVVNIITVGPKVEAAVMSTSPDHVITC